MTPSEPIFRATDGTGRRLEPATPRQLRSFLDDCADFVHLDCPERGTRSYARAVRSDAGSWQVEVRTDQGRLRAEAPNTDAGYDILRSWAAGDQWWRQAFDWTSVPN